MCCSFRLFKEARSEPPPLLLFRFRRFMEAHSELLRCAASTEPPPSSSFLLILLLLQSITQTIMLLSLPLFFIDLHVLLLASRDALLHFHSQGRL